MELKRFGKKENTAPKVKPQKTDRKTAVLSAFGRKKDESSGDSPEIVFGAVTPETPAAYESFMNEGDAFVAGVRSSEPMISVDESVSGKAWKKDLVLNISGAVLLMAFMSLFCMGAYAIDAIPFLIPGMLVFLGITITESVKPGKVRWIVCAVIAGVLLASIVVFHKAIGGGLAGLINQFYDMAESVQAYLYDRLPEPDGGNSLMGAAWASCLIGLIAALPPVKFRRDTLILIAIIAMLAFAYYGMIPSAICIAVLLAALMIAAGRGNILSSLPVMLAVMIIFGAVMLIAPGENYAISRMDENFRDRFALSSRLIENSDMGMDDLSGLDDINEPAPQDTSVDDTVFGGIPRRFVGIAIAVLIIAAIAAVIYLLWKRFDKTRKALREGIDSHDPRTAVMAMFPYSVRWLKAGGVDTDAHPFSELTPYVAGEFSQDYANRYKKMYLLWREAAYSDHRIDDASKNKMEEFMKDTSEMIKEKFTYTDKLRVMLKYSL